MCRRAGWRLSPETRVRRPASAAAGASGFEPSCKLLTRRANTVRARGCSRAAGVAQQAVALTSAGPAPAADGVLGVVRWRGDERPLFVDVDDSGAIGKVGADSGTLVTAGVYFLPKSVFELRTRARQAGLSALRQFLAGVVRWGVWLHAVMLNEVIDIDEAHDLEAARAMLAAKPAPAGPHRRRGSA